MIITVARFVYHLIYVYKERKNEREKERLRNIWGTKSINDYPCFYQSMSITLSST